jgi:hypothetical protein
MLLVANGAFLRGKLFTSHQSLPKTFTYGGAFRKARFSISVAAVVVCFFPSGESEPIKANPARAAKMKKITFKLIKLVLFYAKYPGADFRMFAYLQFRRIVSLPF